jgi:predicted nucleic acid-binding protein
VVDQLAPHEIVVNKKQALRIALEANISSYDAQFVELSMRYAIWLVTEDKELIKKNSRLAISMEDFLLN